MTETKASIELESDCHGIGSTAVIGLVAGQVLPSGDFHTARSAKLRLAHERDASAARLVRGGWTQWFAPPTLLHAFPECRKLGLK